MNHWTDKISVTYDATITDEAALESDLENVFSAPSTPNTNGDVIKDDPYSKWWWRRYRRCKLKAPALDLRRNLISRTTKCRRNRIYTLVVKQIKRKLNIKT